MKNKLKISNPNKILTYANVISLFRALLAAPIVYTMRDPSLGTITLLLILVAILSDALDGWVARRAHEVTYMGKWIDPIADFICLLAVVVYLVIVGKFPFWFFILYIIRYIFVAISALFFIKKYNYILSANWWGKWATGITTIAILFHIWPWEAFPWIKDFAIYLASFLLFISLVVYFKQFYKILKNESIV